MAPGPAAAERTRHKLASAPGLGCTRQSRVNRHAQPRPRYEFISQHDGRLLRHDNAYYSMTHRMTEPPRQSAFPPAAGDYAAVILMITMGSGRRWPVHFAAQHVDRARHRRDQVRDWRSRQFCGASQPIFGAIADRYGSGSRHRRGGVILEIGWALTPLVSSEWR